MQVLDQLVFLGRLHGLDAASAARSAKQWCEKLEIAEALGKKTEELSKGMQQKIQFIAALLHDPELVIMDEPFTGLDPINSHLLESALLDLRQAGKAILFSTHRMDQIEKMCDSISLVNQGREVLSGGVREIKSRYPRNRIALEFEGDGSFLSDPMIAEARNYGNHVQISLKDGADAQELLRRAASQARIYKFEWMEPSLEEIFIHTVRGRADA
jgi:ABC-2 type transport system ATP-binding protein